MRNLFVIFFILCFAQIVKSNEKLYLLAGHGSDIRVYSNIRFPSNVDTIHLHWIKPIKNEPMHDYALRLSKKIDTSESYSIMGLSFGGMLACEMLTFLNPNHVIIVSSASGRMELPLRYRWMKNFEVYRFFSGWFYKSMTKPAQYLFEPDRKKMGSVFDAMIEDKDPDFIKRAIHMIVNWEGNFSTDERIFHIHGTEDHTIPIRNTCSNLEIQNGSHMMLLTQPSIISNALKQIIEA